MILNAHTSVVFEFYAAIIAALEIITRPKRPPGRYKNPYNDLNSCKTAYFRCT